MHHDSAHDSASGTYDPATVDSDDMVALAPYLADRHAEALVLIGSRDGRPCGVTVTPIADLRLSSHTPGLALARQWSLQRPTHMTAIIHARWSSDAFCVEECVLDSKFRETAGLADWDRWRTLWIYGDRQWNEGSLLYDDIRMRPVADPDPVLARMWALGLHAHTPADAPRAPLPDFRSICDGSHLAEREMDDLVWRVGCGALPSTSDWSYLAEALASDPAFLAAALDHLLAGERWGGERVWAALGADSPHHTANATTRALTLLAEWRWGRPTAAAPTAGSQQRFARHVRRLIASGTSADALGLNVSRRF